MGVMGVFMQVLNYLAEISKASLSYCAGCWSREEEEKTHSNDSFTQRIAEAVFECCCKAKGVLYEGCFYVG